MKHNYIPKFFGGLIATLAFSQTGAAQLYDFDTHTFTNASMTGKNGPTLAACQAEYSAEVWELDPTLFNMTTQGIQEWTVPVTGLYELEIAGAQGGDDLFTGHPESGGLGARMIGTFSLTEGDVLHILVGQEGENTRITTEDNAAAGGGGGTFVWDPSDDALPLIAAGGGAGGSGYGYDARNATDAENGNNAFSLINGGVAGNGGRQNTGGSSYWAGGGAGWLTNGTGGNVATAYVADGTYGDGGLRPLEGGLGGDRYIDGIDEGGDGGFGGGGGGGSDNMGTGGGGGYSGGGGQNGDEYPSMNSGGGGGSFNGGTDQENTAGINEGNGYVTITLLCDVIAVEAFESEFCIGNELTLTGTSVSGEAVTWDMGVENGVSFIPVVGEHTYTGSTVSSDDCPFQAVIEVFALPVVTSTSDETIICEGDSIVLTGGGATSYVWDPADIVDGEAYSPEAGDFIYTVTGTDDNGCESTSGIEITVNALPEVLATVDDAIVCIGSDIVFSADGATDYVWDPVDVVEGTPYTPAALGSYTYAVVGTDDNGCENESEVSFEVVDLPTVTATVDEELICLGSSVTFEGGGAESYVWDLGVVNGESFTPGSVGTETYTVIGTDVNGCENTASIDVEATENTLDLTSSLVHETAGSDGEIDITVTGGTPTYIYDWNNDGTGDFDDLEDLTGLSAGTYTVHVMDSEGCQLTQDIILVDQAGIQDLDKNLVSVYPNPTIDNITVNLLGQFDYTIFSLNGSRIISGTSTDSENISLQGLATGEYLLNISSNGKTTTFRVVKK